MVDDGRHAEESGGPAQVLSIKSQNTAHVNPAHSQLRPWEIVTYFFGGVFR